MMPNVVRYGALKNVVIVKTNNYNTASVNGGNSTRFQGVTKKQGRLVVVDDIRGSVIPRWVSVKTLTDS